jgi:hypothetical protein
MCSGQHAVSCCQHTRCLQASLFLRCAALRYPQAAQPADSRTKQQDMRQQGLLCTLPRPSIN